MATAIEFDHVGKQYRLGLVSTKTLSHDLNRWWQMTVRGKEDPYLKIGETNDRTTSGDSEYVWALRDIDFKVEQGDVVGILGKNGAGKSTLLKLLSRVTGPTTGCIRAKGRIGSLLEVGTGFHPEMTGRENIYMNGAIMGMTKNDVTRKLDEIIAFSGCERYIDTPVKRYSSGMTVRLGFAVAAHLEPEILVVDEVLAVGDAEFQKKAIGKMQDVSKGEGRTVLFVSHNMASVSRLCKTGYVLDCGRVVFNGPIHKTIEHYMNLDSVMRPVYRAEVNKSIQVMSIRILNDKGEICPKFLSSESVVIEIMTRNNEKKDIRGNFSVCNSVGVEIFVDRFQVTEGEHLIRLTIPPYKLLSGVYKVNMALDSYGVAVYDLITEELCFEISDLDSEYSSLGDVENGIVPSFATRTVLF